ncbi:hypothetical protein ARMSODRAFT_973298 [Armillaria solidipes]|uniref:CCHC-type domain-containing protein n=1 Tax=Armillaria solidipes TaxID=1076256 RepID=A0A2H3C4G5_9AGAR|nr:hypothetical protein ARMSODRAFT_973298 [Armillaria solidipes]
MYFEVFTLYFQLPSQTVPFAASLFDGTAKDWWVHKRQEFWTDNRSATVYFQELEKEAKLAQQQDGIDEWGHMVRAVHLGIPESYSKAIAFTGFNIPVTYPEWKARVLTIHDSRPPNKGNSNTATSHNKTGGVTSSPLVKPTSNAAPHDTASRKWTTYTRQGEPMDISVLRREGKCFRCKKKGHLSKDCPDKKEYKDIHSIYMAEQVKTEEKEESKIEEDLSATSVLHTLHSMIPPAFNISSTTSKPVLESTNQYATLSVESINDDNDEALKGSTNGLPARAQAKAVKPAGHGAESLIDVPDIGTNCFTREPGPNSPPEEAAPQEEKTARIPKDDKKMEVSSTFALQTRATPGPRVGIKMWPPTSEGTGETGNSTFAVQAQPDTFPMNGPSTRSGVCNSTLIPKGWDEDIVGICERVRAIWHSGMMSKILIG